MRNTIILALLISLASGAVIDDIVLTPEDINTKIIIKADVPSEFKERFELVLANLMTSLTKELELSVAKEIVSKSKFTEQDIEELSNKVKLSMNSDLLNKGLI